MMWFVCGVGLLCLFVGAGVALYLARKADTCPECGIAELAYNLEDKVVRCPYCAYYVDYQKRYHDEEDSSRDGRNPAT